VLLSDGRSNNNNINSEVVKHLCGSSKALLGGRQLRQRLVTKLHEGVVTGTDGSLRRRRPRVQLRHHKRM
jgi:hypothetical protein